MTAATIHVRVTAEHIAAAPVVPETGDGFKSTHPNGKDPVELAIADVTGQDVTCDQDDELEMATIGSGATVLVVSLPAEQAAWIENYYRGEAVEPFEFDIAIEDWLTSLCHGVRPWRDPRS